MLLEFFKYQGTGNDFIMIDNRENIFDPDNLLLVQKLCNRKFGIGADGLILIQHHPDYDFEVIYFNADGSKSLCGNGSRCAVQFARFLNLIDNKTTFLAIDGPHEAFVKEELVYLRMNNVTAIHKKDSDYFLNTGSPHYVKFVEQVNSFDVFNEGKKIRNSDQFKKEGINVNFAEKVDAGKIFVRTYERGVEDETFSCGTGVTACALVTGLLGMSSPVKVSTLGGDLMISFDRSGEEKFENIYLIGPGEFVYKGQIDINIQIKNNGNTSELIR
ncbi:MAG TPA: diaminopimelate epimerase [Cytophagales bacterium]|nr:diaminopimelate epimerase [Cytophagales bacterium]